MGRVADACFPTPTALGAWLRDAAGQKRLRARQQEEARLLARSLELLGQLGQLQAARKAVARWRAVAALLAALLAAGALWLLKGW